jgi:hypothetical protein
LSPEATAALQAAIEQNRRIVLEKNAITIDRKWCKETPVPVYLIRYLDQGVIKSNNHRKTVSFYQMMVCMLIVICKIATGHERTWYFPQRLFLLGSNGQD